MDTLDPTVYGLVQDAGTTEPGFSIPGVDYTTNVGLETGYGVTPYDVDNTHDAGHHELMTFRYAGTDAASWYSWGSYSLYRLLVHGAWRPTGLPAGEYTVDVHTHGYVMRRAFGVQVPAVGAADIAADLIQGGQIRVVASFKHEAIKVPFTGFVRVEVLDAAGNLVGASIYGQAEPNTFTKAGNGGGYLYDAEWNLAAMNVPGPAQAAGFNGPYDLFPSASNGQRAMFSSLYYNVPYCPDELNPACQVWASWDYMTPIDANMFVNTRHR